MELRAPQTKIKCPHCGRGMVPHIYKDGAAYHVTRWMSVRDAVNDCNTGVRRCSDLDCEDNHGPDKCAAFEAYRARNVTTRSLLTPAYIDAQQGAE